MNTTQKTKKQLWKEREKLLDRIIKIYGFEHFITIQFANMIEEYALNELNNRVLDIFTQAHEYSPYLEE